MLPDVHLFEHFLDLDSYSSGGHAILGNHLWLFAIQVSYIRERFCTRNCPLGHHNRHNTPTSGEALDGT